MKAYVYLNDGDSHWFGFRPEHAGRLSMVGALEHEDGHDDTVILEVVFEQLNCNQGYDHRSLSVGDVVLLVDDAGQRAYACQPTGWDRLSDFMRVTEVAR